MNEDISGSPAYLIGQVACTMVFPEATLIRDFTSNVYSGDYLGAAMDIGGTKYAGKLFTVLKDSSVVTAFVKKVGPTEPPIGKKLMDTLWEQKIYRTELPAADKVGVLDKAFDGAATKLSGQGVSDEVIAGIYEHKGDITKTLKAGERADNTVVWIEEGTTKWGWQHIVEGHWLDITNKFGSKTETDVQDMITSTISLPDETISHPGDEYQYIKKFTGSL